MISKAKLVNQIKPDSNISELQSTHPKLYRAIKNIGDASQSLINNVFPPTPVVPFEVRFLIEGAGNPAGPANDVLNFHYHVILPVDANKYWKYENINLTACYITAQVLGTTSTYSVDIKVSQQKGTTSFKSLFKPGFNPMLPTGVISTHNVTFAIASLFQDDLLRLDVLATDPIMAGIEIVLIGNYSLSEVFIP
jgi:hypothetical protein